MKQIFFLLVCTTLCLTGMSQTGLLDKTFANNGLLVAGNSGMYGQTTASIILKDDKILALNSYIENGGGNRLTRFHSDGEIDTSFGIGGSQEILKAIGGFYSLSIQQDDKIVLVSNSSLEYFLVITLFRYLPDGTPDSTFGINGIFVDSSAKETTSFDATLQPDGKIVVCGQYVDDPNNGFIYPLIARYNEDGMPDKSFGNNGKNILPELDFLPYSIALQKDNKIVCAGDDGTQSEAMLVRYNNNGSLDKSFGTNGVVKTLFTRYGDFFTDIGIQEHNKIIAVGTAQYNSGNLSLRPQMAVARYNPNGSLDETFDKDGKTMIPFAIYTLGKSVALQPDGKIVLSCLAANENADYGVGRLNADGSFDSEFGTEGKTITDINEGSYDEVYQVGLQSTGNIIVSGFTVDANNQYSTVIARYIGGKAQNAIPIAKIKSWLQEHALNWRPIYTSGNIDFYAIEKSKSRSGVFSEVKRYQAEALPQPLVTRENVTYSYNLATEATAGATSVSYYRVRAVYNGGNSVYSDVVSDSLLIQDAAITIYPNPVKNELTLSGLNAQQTTVISLLNRNGNLLATEKLRASVYKHNVAALKPGVYYIQAVQGGKTQRIKFIKE